MFNVTDIVQHGGLLLLGFFLWAEVGLFLGFFLPGDTLLITAGIFAKQGKLSLAAVILVAGVAAIAGDSTAYFIGRKAGPKIFQKEDSILFKPEHVQRARLFYDKYGPKTLLIAHFVPVVRTFSPLFAGIAAMPYKRFLTFDAIGDTAWAVGVTLVGYYVGSRIPNVDHYILFVVLGAVVITLAPTLFHIATVIIRRHTKAKAGKTTKKS